MGGGGTKGGREKGSRVSLFVKNEFTLTQSCQFQS